MARGKKNQPVMEAVGEVEVFDYCSDCGTDLAISEIVSQKGNLLQFCDNCKDKPENKLRNIAEPPRCDACGFIIPGVVQAREGKTYCTQCIEAMDAEPELVHPKIIEEQIEQLEFPMKEEEPELTEAQKGFIAAIDEALLEATKPDEVICTASTDAPEGSILAEAAKAFNEQEAKGKREPTLDEMEATIRQHKEKLIEKYGDPEKVAEYKRRKEQMQKATVTELQPKKEPAFSNPEQNKLYAVLKQNDVFYSNLHVNMLAEIQKVQDQIDDLLDPEKRRVKAERLNNKAVKLREELDVFEGIWNRNRKAKDDLGQMYLPGFAKEA